MPRFLAALTAILLLLTIASAQDRRLVPSSAGSERRLALVVGNDTYRTAPLTNARNDARAVAAALQDVGFRVSLVLDAKRSDMGAAVDTFAKELRPDDVAVFYYAGHGLQVEGSNYLVPVDYTGQDEVAARWDTMPVGRVQDALRTAKVTLVILDACRNNPYRGTRATGGGLAPMEARGSLIAFAADAGQTAGDNAAGDNGLFTTHLLTAIKTPGLGVREVFRRAREEVVRATGGRQFPAVYDGLVGEFVFRSGTATPAGIVAAAAPASAADADLARREEITFWESIKDAGDRGLFEEYLKRYGGQGRFSVVARARLESITSPGPTPAPAATPPAVRYQPTRSGSPWGDALNTMVTRRDLGAQSEFQVEFTLPTAIPEEPLKFWSNRQGSGLHVWSQQERSSKSYDLTPDSVSPPTTQWKPGDRVTFVARVPKERSDPKSGWSLRFCAGAANRDVCFVGPDLFTSTTAQSPVSDPASRSPGQSLTALTSDPTMADLHYNQGVIFWNTRRFAEARASFEAAITWYPDHALAHFQLGMTLVNVGDLKRAATEFQRYLALDPQGPNAAIATAMLAQQK